MLRLKGVTIFGETKEFYVDRVVAIDGTNGNWWVEIDNKTYVLDPATIQPADDPRKHPMFTMTCPNCDYEYMDPFEDGSFECPECELYLPPKKDPRKAMLDEIREKINNLTEYKTFVRVEGDPVPTLPQIAKWCVIWILDEMEAKL